MTPSELQGRWNLIEIEYPPVEPGEDDGGFSDEGMGSVSSAEDLGLEAAFIEFKAGGSFGGRYWSEESGEWSIKDDKPVVLLGGDAVAITVSGESMERNDFDEEHGRRMIVRYERVEEKGAVAKKAGAKKLTKKLEKQIGKMWDTVCECDHLDEGEFREVLEAGGAAAAKYMESEDSDVWLLSAAINHDQWGIARLMLENGADPNVTEDGPFIEAIESRFGDSKSPEVTGIIALLREKGAEG